MWVGFSKAEVAIEPVRYVRFGRRPETAVNLSRLPNTAIGSIADLGVGVLSLLRFHFGLDPQSLQLDVRRPMIESLRLSNISRWRPLCHHAYPVQVGLAALASKITGRKRRCCKPSMASDVFWPNPLELSRC